MIPGEYILKKESIKANCTGEVISITVINTGDRPIQIGSHFHFFEINKMMEFDRNKALGMRLNIVSGTAVRFEPSEEKEIELISIGGNRIIYGFNNKVDSKLPAIGTNL
ncbi:urease subunit beta [uncultured Zobellia sp.]|uniref:urease subunit beta n=1 Tax=uncultured Zobellia sp. TaxID=255433 RepID=UPI00259A6CDD|nr:urease subunit beta [uncultured Zobellia sp.]